MIQLFKFYNILSNEILPLSWWLNFYIFCSKYLKFNKVKVLCDLCHPLQQYLQQTMKNDQKKRINHGENHPNINHFNISCQRQWLRYPQETITLYCIKILIMYSYKVVSTSNKVVFTSMTMSRNLLLKNVDIWLESEVWD